MQNETALWLDRTTEMHRRIGCKTGFDLELREQFVQAQIGDYRPGADPDRAILVMCTHRDRRAFEARIADAGKREQ